MAGMLGSTPWSLVCRSAGIDRLAGHADLPMFAQTWRDPMLGICRARFTGPKHLRAMLRALETQRLSCHDEPARIRPASERVNKRFDRPAVDGLDLTVRTGEFYALLGPNGAGKTTTLRMVTGLLKPDAGAISVVGIDALADPVAAKRMMAWVSDEPMIYDKLTPLEYLEFVAGCGASMRRRRRAGARRR